jgi:LPS sulfotransferase NodH
MSDEAKSTPFMIFATQRTGSNWLMTMLDSHPAIASYDELLEGTGSDWGRPDVEFFDPYYARHRKRDHPLARARWLFRYLNKLYSPRQGTEAIGMKLMYNELWYNPLVLIYMMRRRVRVVHLVRMNHLDILLSEETARARQQFHAWKGDVIEMPTVTLDPKKVISRLKTLEYCVKIARCILALLPIKHFDVTYEDLSANPPLVYDIVAFLEVPTRPELPTLASRLMKLNTYRKPELIENYTEIERALKGTRFERFLAE